MGRLLLLAGELLSSAGFTQILETSFFFTSFIITILAVHVLVSWIFTLKFLTEMTGLKYENKIVIWEVEKLTSDLVCFSNERYLLIIYLPNQMFLVLSLNKVQYKFNLQMQQWVGHDLVTEQNIKHLSP